MLTAIVRQTLEPFPRRRLRHSRLKIVLVNVNITLLLLLLKELVGRILVAVLPASALGRRPSNEILTLKSLSELFNFVFFFDFDSFDLGCHILLVLWSVLVLLSLSKPISSVTLSWCPWHFRFVLQLIW